MFTPRHTRRHRSDKSVPRTIARYRRVTLALLPHVAHGFSPFRSSSSLATASGGSARPRFAESRTGDAAPLRWLGVDTGVHGLPQSMRHVGTAIRHALPDAASFLRFAHSASVTGVMVGIAFGLWAAPTLAHWNTDPGLRSATLTTADTRTGEPPSKHWVRVTEHDPAGAPPSRSARDDSPPSAPDRVFAVPRGDLRKDISDANRDAGPRMNFSGH